MTFLELCQMVALESGTFPVAVPTTVTGQTGRLQKVVHWTATAYTLIQTRQKRWQWLEAEYSHELTPGSGTYTAASFSLSRFNSWFFTKGPHDFDAGVTIYKTSIGVADEGPLLFMDWPIFRATYERGSQNNNRPIHFTVKPNNSIAFGPKPDVAYTARGMYRKSQQTLADDGDIPEMPSDYHELIAWEGLLLLAEHDEAPFATAIAARRARETHSNLLRDQLPSREISAAAPPLA